MCMYMSIRDLVEGGAYIHIHAYIYFSGVGKDRNDFYTQNMIHLRTFIGTCMHTYSFGRLIDIHTHTHTYSFRRLVRKRRTS
jgi:hypothetical protein